MSYQRTGALWDRPASQKGLSAAEARSRIISGEPWEHMVPAAAAALVKRWGLRDRLIELHGKEAGI